MLSEALILGALVIAGESYLRLCGSRKWSVLVSLAVPTGAALLGLTGLLGMLLRTPIRPVTALTSLAVGLLAYSVTKRVRLAGDWAFLGLIVVVVGVLAAAVQETGLFTNSWDSFEYGESAALFARDGSPSWHPTHLLERRSPGFAYVHALAVETGIGSYLPSFSPVLALSTLAFLGVSATSALTSSRLAAAPVIATLLVIFTATSHRFAYATFYLNAHAWAACIAIVTVGAIVMIIGGRVSGLGRMAVIAPSLAVLVLVRPEGALLAAVFLAPLAITRWPGITLRDVKVLFMLLGGATLAWQAGVLFPAFPQAPSSVILGGALGATLLAAPCYLGLTTRLSRRTASTVLVLSWCLAMVGAAILDAGFSESIVATYENVVLGKGLWGKSLVVLTGGLVVGLCLFRSDVATLPLFPYLAILPVGMWLAIARDGGFRVGPGDSFNRMLIHVLPLGVLALAALLGGTPRWSKQSRTDRDPRPIGTMKRDPA